MAAVATTSRGTRFSDKNICHVPINILLIHCNSDDSSLRIKIFLATGEFLPNIPPWSAGTLGTVECRSRSLLGLGTPHSAGKQQCGGRSCGGWSWRHFPPDTATPHLATRTTLRHGVHGPAAATSATVMWQVTCSMQTTRDGGSWCKHTYMGFFLLWHHITYCDLECSCDGSV